MSKTRFRAPAHLRPETAEWWRGVMREYLLEPHHIRLLTAAAEAWDEYQTARELVEKEGMVQTDRFGQKKPHPANNIARDARTAFARLIRELALDVEAPDSRPPGIGGNSHRRGGL